MAMLAPRAGLAPNHSAANTARRSASVSPRRLPAGARTHREGSARETAKGRFPGRFRPPPSPPPPSPAGERSAAGFIARDALAEGEDEAAAASAVHAAAAAGVDGPFVDAPDCRGWPRGGQCARIPAGVSRVTVRSFVSAFLPGGSARPVSQHTLLCKVVHQWNGHERMDEVQYFCVGGRNAFSVICSHCWRCSRAE